MNTVHFIWFTCFLSAVMTIKSNSIDPSVHLGQFINIEAEVVIEANSGVGSFARIAGFTHISANTQVGSYSNIGERCTIANNVDIGSYANVANDVVIGSDSILGGYSSVGNGATIGNRVKLDKFSRVGSQAEIRNRVKLNQYSAVGNNARIEDDSILDKFSSVGEYAVISSKAYVGQYSQVPPHGTVGELAVILNFVGLDSGTNVKPKQVVIRTPSSYDLYQSCELNVPAEKANTADQRSSGVVSPEFNSMLGQMIETELNTLKANCAQGGIGQQRPTTLPEIISLYLIQYHGLQRFNEIKQQIGQMSGFNSININMADGNVFINGNSPDSSLLWQLQHEYHFGNDSPKDILQPDVKQKLIQLLAIDQDAQRHERVINDDFCKLLQEILSGDRDVTCAKPILSGPTVISN